MVPLILGNPHMVPKKGLQTLNPRVKGLGFKGLGFRGLGFRV